MKHIFVAILVPIILFYSRHVYCQTWNPAGNVGFSSDTTYFTSITSDKDGVPYVVYRDNGNGGKAIVMKYAGGSWVAVGSMGFSAGGVESTKIVTDSAGTPYVAYVDDFFSVGRITVMKYNGSNWVVVGSEGFAQGDDPDIAIWNDIPYVVYSSCCLGAATVVKYNGSSWVTVGSAEFSDSLMYWPSIAIENDTPYVVYSLSAPFSVGKVAAMKYDGSSWVNVGSSSGFSAGIAYWPSIAIDRVGTPYVSYVDYGNSQKATVMKYYGGSWTNVGNAGFSNRQSGPIAISIDSGGYPYVFYADSGNNYKATVMKFNGSTWVSVGDSDFSAGAIEGGQMTINKNGIPYVVYSDFSDSLKATVMKFDFTNDVKSISITNNHILIYPNPAETQLTISTSGRITAVAISNVLGQLVYSNQYNSPQVQVDVASLPAGVYFLKVNGVEVRKFIKQ